MGPASRPSLSISGGIHLHGAATDSPADFVTRFEEQLAVKLGIAQAVVTR